MEQQPTTYNTKYICPLHKVSQTGTYRPTFEKSLHTAILDASMGNSMRLYKEVIRGCHCQINYKAFDTLVQHIQLGTKGVTQQSS